MDSKKETVTIYDIAAAAQVSPGTVSRVINNVGYIKPETKERVTQAIQELHYVPNRAARSLKNNRTNLICLAFPEADNPFFFALIGAVQEVAKQHHYSLMIYYTKGSPEEELNLLNMMNEKIVDGLFLINFNYTEEHFKAIRRVRCPLVVSSLCVSPYGGNETDNFDYVGIDVRRALYLSTIHMLKQGHRRVALIGGDKSIYVFRERFEGYCSAHVEMGVPVDMKNCFFGDYDQNAGYEAALRILNMKDRPTAVCAASDVMALGAIAAFQENHIRIPEDIAIVGMDDVNFVKFLSPPLSSIYMAQRDMGRYGAEFLFRRLEGDDSPSQKIIFQPKLIIRQSSSFTRPPE